MALALALATQVGPAHAFCGFYVSGSNEKMFNDATQVVLVRDGTRTVLSMQNDYKGPLEDFAMVVPVPVVLKEQDVKTLPKDVFQHTDSLGSPRLVEYWEQDPCPSPDLEKEKDDAPMTEGRVMQKGGMASQPAPRDSVKIEAKFDVAEYKILILSATDSTGLERWLAANRYKIPPGAEPLLRPYVEQGSKFFVAKVDPSKVKFDKDQRAALSPLRFHYDSDEFSLPIRLGLANSSGTQDLIVNILAPHQRYNVANYKNITIPTNIDVSEAMKDKFAAFYTALFDRTLEKNPGAIVTEYAWQATTCDPCPGPSLMPEEIMTLGGDVLPSPANDFVLTRLHARYGKELADDLRFEVAPAIVGGREQLASNGQLEQGTRPDDINNFQARYAIRHPWTGPITCKDPKRGRWGGQDGGDAAAPKPATQIAYAKRDAVQLPLAIARDIPELGVKAGVVEKDVKPAAVDKPIVAVHPPKSGGCGCESSDSSSLAMIGIAGLALRRRRRPAPPGAR